MGEDDTTADGGVAGEPDADAAHLASESDLLLGRLRSIVLEPYAAQLREYEQRIDALRAEVEELKKAPRDLKPEAVGEILPAAVLARGDNDEKLASALRPLVESSLHQSVRDDPQPLIDAIFPIIGPAIRRAVATAMRGLVAAVNRTVESTFTPRGIRWRIEAWRTGRPYGEVVLKHTLLYRVEGAYLIHRESGLLLHHAVAAEVEVQDPALVSSMLTAIEDFARDSFTTDGDQGLEQIRVGDLTVLIEPGPQAGLALAVRGVAVPSIRTHGQTVLEEIHADYRNELQVFDGQNAAFEPTHALLQTCLRDEAREPKRFPVAAAAFAALLVIVGGWLLVSWVDGRVERRQWTAYLERLQEQPGLMVVHSEERDGTYRLVGLRDPLAPDPAKLLEDHTIEPDRVDARWEFYRAQHPQFVLARARGLLKPPASVSLDIVDRTLRARGAASAAWIANAERLVPLIPGVMQWDTRELRDARLAVFDAPIAALEKIQLDLADSDFQGHAEASSNARTLRLRLIELDTKAARAHVRVVVRLVVPAADGAAGEAEWKLATRFCDKLMEESWQATRLKVVRNSPSSPHATDPSSARTVEVRAHVRFAELSPPRVR